VNSTTRTADQTEQALFWADGGGSYTPPGHWTQIAAQVAAEKGNSLSANARLMAQLNIALADAAIACWDTKYHYTLWRPVTAIQNADVDGNAATAQESGWTPLLITPPHPSFVSGHSTFSAAATGILAATFGDNTSFSTTSATLPGVTRSFTSFSQAANEAGISRIYGGIHFEFDNQAGKVIGEQVAAAVLSRFGVTQDTKAPTIVVDATPAASKTNLTFAGHVFDNLSGVASANYSIDGATPQTLTLDAGGNFSVTTTFAIDGTADGTHTLIVNATDAQGNTTATPFTRSFRLDTLAPVVTLSSIAQDAALDSTSRLTGSVNSTGTSITSLSYKVDSGTVRTISFDSNGSFDQALPLGNLDVGNHTLTINTIDAAGNATSLVRNVTIAALTPFVVSRVTPADGASDVGVTFRPQVYFSRAVNPGTLTANSFYATGADGAKLPTTIVPSLDGSFAWLFFTNPLPSGANVTLHVDGAAVRAAADGAFLDGDSNGTTGGEKTWTFTTVNNSSVAGTKLIGKIVDPGADLLPMTFDDIRRGPDGVIHTTDDVFLNPIAGATVFVVGRPDLKALTDASGNFAFDNVPAGNIKVAIDGRTATNAPSGVFWPEMVMDVTLRPGVTNTLMGTMGSAQSQTDNADRVEIYLPRVLVSSLQTVSNEVNTTITVDQLAAANLTDEQRGSLTLTVAPGSAVDENGQAITDVQVGISTVPPELVRDMLPPGVLEHTFDITIQAPGVNTFNQPLQITFPNVFNAAPGTKLNILSFDHTTGRLVINGTATVSSDGKTVVSDEGSGVVAPGWHGLTPPGTQIQLDELGELLSILFTEIDGAVSKKINLV
ncbi:MAG: phosphatase PAP2 family protein, partial [Rhodoferax sp.]|nr:phosphatase PAP2 family protein [Rhodoferax sp.]